MLELYNQGADHYDKVNQKEYGDIYRTRIQELISRPEIVQVLTSTSIDMHEKPKRSMTMVTKPKPGLFPEEDKPK